MKALKTLSLVTALIALLLVIVILTVPIIVGLDFIKPYIAGPLEKALQRKVSLEDDIDVVWALPPAIVFNTVRVANAPWGSATHMMRIARISAAPDWLGILSGNIRMDQLQIAGAVVSLEKRPDGDGSTRRPGKPVGRTRHR